jgi:hypothetical protein
MTSKGVIEYYIRRLRIDDKKNAYLQYRVSSIQIREKEEEEENPPKTPQDSPICIVRYVS